MYMVYSFFLIFIIMMLSTLMINNYKKSFLNKFKNNIKEELNDDKLEIKNKDNIEDFQDLELNLLDIKN